jgi:2-polyprenyl-3-methyl-5-hydroxy-6-metoxy-1,4-benzoquinol methylase
MAIVARNEDNELLDAIVELAEYLGEDPVATAFNVGNSFFTAAERWHQSNPTQSHEIADYYRQTKSLLHQLVFANYGIPHELALIELVHSLFDPEASVLDLGGGIGSLLLSVQCREKTHADFDGELLKYARWRYQRAGQPVTVVPLEHDYIDREPLGTFDAVICTEVIEHAPDPEALVSYLSKLVRPGGKLLATVSFDDVGGTVPQHLNVERWTDEAFVAEVFPRHGLSSLTGDLYVKI